MQLLVLLLSLLSFAFGAEMAFVHEYEGVPIFMIYGPGGQPIGLAELQPGQYSIVFTESQLFTRHGRSFLWRYSPEGRLCAKLNDDTLICLRGQPHPNGKFYLVAAKPSCPLETGQLDTWDIRCQSADEPYRCVIKLEGFMVPYRDNPEDMRPLVLDFKVNGPQTAIFWPMIPNQNQVFTIVPVEL